MRSFAGTVLALAGAFIALHAAGVEADPGAYRFIGGEKIQIKYDPPTVGDVSEQSVSDEGTVSLPSGSLVNIRGKTPSEARALIAARVQQESTAKSVQARLLVLDYPPRKIYVAGEVRIPKSITLTPGVPLSMLAALQEAGGISERGDANHVNLVHTDENGKHVSEVIDTTRLAQPGSAELGPKLTAGDVVVVPKGDQYTFVGEFVRSGRVAVGELSLEPGEKPLLSRVIAGNGGFKHEADLSKLKVLRLKPDGSREVLSVDTAAPTRKDIALQNGDIIEIGSKVEAEKKELRTVTVTGKVRAPGTYPIGENGLKLSKLIMLAGGLSDFAKGKHVTINRPSEGRLIVVDVESILKRACWELDVDVLDGDLVNVPERAF